MHNIIENAVQPVAWYKALPRVAYQFLERIEQPEPWFEVYRLPHDIYAIYEPAHFQEVISYLILGSERALLLDTGLGIGNMLCIVKSLTALPIDVVNSHCHFDHIGDNWRFDSVYCFNHLYALERLKKGMPAAKVRHHLSGDSTWLPYPDGFLPDTYCIRPCNPLPIEAGHVFELGNRRLEVLHTPGHSPDSIMLLDKQASILFTGDTFYPAVLYAHLDEDGITSIFETYRSTMNDLASNIQVKTLLTSHNEPMVSGSTLQTVAQAFNAIAEDQLPYVVDKNGLRKYTFKGFCIVTHNPPL